MNTIAKHQKIVLNLLKKGTTSQETIRKATPNWFQTVQTLLKSDVIVRTVDGYTLKKHAPIRHNN